MAARQADGQFVQGNMNGAEGIGGRNVPNTIFPWSKITIQVLDPGPRILGAGSGSSMRFQDPGLRLQGSSSDCSIWNLDPGPGRRSGAGLYEKGLCPGFAQGSLCQAQAMLTSFALRSTVGSRFALSEKFAVG